MAATARNPYEHPLEPLARLLGDLDREWTLQAACRDHNCATHGCGNCCIFYPPPARGSVGMTQSQSELRRKLKIAEAKSVCARCPVATQCLAYGDAIGDYHAIWGGLTPRQRGRKREQ